MDGSEIFYVTFRGGGGPVPFHRALARSLARLAARRSSCVIVSAVDRPTRYVQALVSPAGVRVESVGSMYLAGTGDSLSASQIVALDALGWLAPPEPHEDPHWSWPHNWWRELGGPGFIDDAAALMITTLVEVHDLCVDEVVRLETFPADNPAYRWRVDPRLPCGGRLEAI